jgi:thioredoxin reductase (NADPH)
MERVIILGSGPAGLTAALYAARAELNPLVITGTEIGGQMGITDIIENYPGFPEGIRGPELIEKLINQAQKFGARLEIDVVKGVDFKNFPYKIFTSEKEFESLSVIIATGASPRKLGVPGERELTGKGVSYCATCDGHFFKDQDVVVVGGGDSALEEGIFLTRYASRVRIIHRRDKLRAGKLLQKRAMGNPKISFILNSIVTEIVGEEEVHGVKIKDVKTNEIEFIETKGVFIFIGHEPNTEIFKGQLELDERGYIKTDGRTRTGIPGVFAAGEVQDPIYRQIVTSAGSGCMAAIEAEKYLSLKFPDLMED